MGQALRDRERERKGKKKENLLLRFEEFPVQYATRKAVMRGLDSEIVWMGAEAFKMEKQTTRKL